jgi:hypothetical protein
MALIRYETNPQVQGLPVVQSKSSWRNLARMTRSTRARLDWEQARWLAEIWGLMALGEACISADSITGWLAPAMRPNPMARRTRTQQPPGATSRGTEDGARSQGGGRGRLRREPQPGPELAD